MRVEWMPPARGHVHPVQEVMAFMMAVQAGFTSRAQVAAEFGYDIEEIDLQNAKGSARAGELRLPYSVYEGAGKMGPTQISEIVKALQKKSVMDALKKMVEEEAA